LKATFLVLLVICPEYKWEFESHIFPDFNTGAEFEIKTNLRDMDQVLFWHPKIQEEME